MRDEVRADDFLLPAEILEYDILLDLRDLIEKIAEDLESSKIEEEINTRMFNLKWSIGNRLLQWQFREMSDKKFSAIKKYIGQED